MWPSLGAKSSAGLVAISVWGLTACTSPPTFLRVERDPEPTESPTPTETPPAETPAPRGPPPLNGEVGKWTWLDVPESKCANGEPTGLGVNIGTGSDLLIFLEGGGACWDELSCAAGFALNIGGYQQQNFQADLETSSPAIYPLTQGGVFDRTAPNNPFREASIVYVPYCTGDVHGGDATQQFFFPLRTMHYAGRRNIEAYLEQIVPAFKTASHVTLSGRSAGGFGAAINYWRVQDAFGAVRVDLVDDSGPAFTQSNMGLFPIWKAVWHLDGALPEDCGACRANIRAVYSHYSKTYPSSRFSLLSYDQDKTISQFFLMLLPGIFAANLRGLMEDTLAPLPNFRYFVTSGSEHTMVHSLATKSGDVALGTFLTEQITGSADWKNVAPN